MIEKPSRRAFLRRTSSAALGPVITAGLADRSALFASTLAVGEEYWQMVRRQFAFLETKVPMNAANMCPSPRFVAAAFSCMSMGSKVLSRCSLGPTDGGR